MKKDLFAADMDDDFIKIIARTCTANSLYFAFEVWRPGVSDFITPPLKYGLGFIYSYKEKWCIPHRDPWRRIFTTTLGDSAIYRRWSLVKTIPPWFLIIHCFSLFSRFFIISSLKIIKLLSLKLYDFTFSEIISQSCKWIFFKFIAVDCFSTA